MDAEQFDDLARRLGSGLSRRFTRGRVVGLAASSLAALLFSEDRGGAKKKHDKKNKKKSKKAKRKAAETTYRNQFVGKSYIGPVRLQNTQSTQMQQMASFFGMPAADPAEDPKDGAKIPRNTLGYRMRTAMDVSLTCAGKKRASTQVHNADFYDMGFENLALIPGWPGTNPGWVQGVQSFPENPKTGPRVRSVQPTPGGADCVSFELAIKGLPHPVAMDGACTLFGYEPREIQHTVTATVCCDGTVQATITGTKFPSHRLFVNGTAQETVMQGPLEELMRIDHPAWQPKSNLEFGFWSSLPALAMRALICASTCLGGRSERRQANRAGCPVPQCPPKAVCGDKTCNPIGGCCLCDDGSCRPLDECCPEERFCSDGTCIDKDACCSDVDLDTDPENCGVCGYRCADDETCRNGECQDRKCTAILRAHGCELVPDITEFWNCVGRNLAGVDFTGCDLASVDFDEANLANAVMVEANLTGTTFFESDVTGVLWSNTICPSGVNSDSDEGTCCGQMALPFKPPGCSVSGGNCRAIRAECSRDLECCGIAVCCPAKICDLCV